MYHHQYENDCVMMLSSGYKSTNKSSYKPNSRELECASLPSAIYNKPFSIYFVDFLGKESMHKDSLK